LLTTCIEDVRELLAAKISTDAGFADSIVAEVAADEVATLTTPATLFITAIGVLLDVCVLVQCVAFLHRQQHRHHALQKCHNLIQ